VDAIEDVEIKITNENFGGLTRLCEEFGFGVFAGKLSEFRQSARNSGLDDPLLLARLSELERQRKTDLARISELEKKMKELWFGVDSKIVTHLPIAIFGEFVNKQLVLLWRGTRDGFNSTTFHSRCDGHSNTVTFILDIGGFIFGGFTPLPWEITISSWKKDESKRSFVFTLKNPSGTEAMKFLLSQPDDAIYCSSGCGPVFGNGIDICVEDNNNLNKYSSTNLGTGYVNNTGRDGKTFFTGERFFQVKEIEVFEIKD
jgi:hypothetical protein